MNGSDKVKTKLRKDQWNKSMEEWQTKKSKRIIALKEKLKQEEQTESQHCTFQPNINKSVKLEEEVEIVGIERHHKLYHDHFIYKKHINKIKEDITPSFKPKVNNNKNYTNTKSKLLNESVSAKNIKEGFLD